MAKKKIIKKSAKKVKKVSKSKGVVKANIAKSITPIVPLGDRVLVRDLGNEEMYKTTASGIILPETAKDEGGKRGKVVAVGEGRFEHGVRIPLSVEVGQTVLYSWGDKISVSGEEYIIVRESEIIAIINS
jgi:chaperonin GroES